MVAFTTSPKAVRQPSLSEQRQICRHQILIWIAWAKFGIIPGQEAKVMPAVDKTRYRQYYEVVIPQSRDRVMENVVRAMALAPPSGVVYRITGRSKEALDFEAAGLTSAIKGVTRGHLKLEERTSGETFISCNLSFYFRGLFMAIISSLVAGAGVLFTVLDTGDRNPINYLALVAAVFLPWMLYVISQRSIADQFRAFLHNLQYLG